MSGNTALAAVGRGRKRETNQKPVTVEETLALAEQRLRFELRLCSILAASYKSPDLSQVGLSSFYR